jgi:predicted transposase YbfD/YdcC
MDDIIKEIEKLRREHTELLEALIDIMKNEIYIDAGNYEKCFFCESQEGKKHEYYCFSKKYKELIEKATNKTWKEICEK